MPGKPPADRPACRATTKAGDPCRNRASAGSMFCASHGGATRKIGAPSLLDVALADEILESVRAGLAYREAAAVVGVHRGTIAEWKRRGLEDLEAGAPTAYAYLADGLTRARARGERSLVERIHAHSHDDWRAAAWLLERRHPERYSRRTAVDVTNAQRSEPIDVLPSDEDRTLIEGILADALRDRLGAGDPDTP